MKIFIKRMIKQKILISLFISYVLVLLIPYIVNRVNYISVENAMMKEIQNYNSEYLYRRSQTLDAIIANVSDMIDSIMLNKDFREAASFTAPLTPRQRYRLSTDNSYIYGGFEFYVENVFVILKNADCYVGQNGAGNLKNFYKGHYGNVFPSYEEWYEFMSRRYYGELLVYPEQNAMGDGKVFYAMSYMDVGDNEKLLANIIVEFKKSFLLFDSNEKNSFLIVDENNRVIVSDQSEAFNKAVNKALAAGGRNNIVYMKSNNRDKVLSVQKMKQSDWKYVSCISKDVFLEKIVRMRRNYIYSLLVCILAGGIVIWKSVKRHYAPIKKLTKTLSGNFAFNSELNEYQYLTAVVSDLVNKYREDSQYQKLEKKIAKNYFLLSVLKGEEPLCDIPDRLEHFGVHFRYSCFCVMAVKIEDCSRLFFERDEPGENTGLTKFIIENVLADFLREKFESAFCENDDELFALIELPNQDSIHQLRGIITETQKTIEDLSNVSLFVSLSSAQEGIENVSMCYRQATELIRRCSIRNEFFLSYDEQAEKTRGENENYIYSADIEQKLVNYLTYGNYEKSRLILQEILNNNLKNNVSASLKGKCLFFDIAATVFKVIGNSSDSFDAIDIEENGLLEKIDRCESLSSVQEEILTLFRQICDNSKRYVARTTEKLADDIADFIKANYKDQNLNVAFISRKFNVSANYASATFKKEKKIPMLAYINAVRIEHARALLKNTNLKVTDISAEVGFASQRTFLRVFGSIVGVSPAEYRKTGRSAPDSGESIDSGVDS